MKKLSSHDKATVAGKENIGTLLTLKNSLLGAIEEVLIEGATEGQTAKGQKALGSDEAVMLKHKQPAQEQDMATVENSPFQQ